MILSIAAKIAYWIDRDLNSLPSSSPGKVYLFLESLSIFDSNKTEIELNRICWGHLLFSLFSFLCSQQDMLYVIVFQQELFSLPNPSHFRYMLLPLLILRSGR